MKFLAQVAIVLVLAIVVASQTDYGSYVAVCTQDSQNVTFINYPHQNCQGTPSNYTSVINQCFTDLYVLSWKAGCNSTNIWYANYLGTTCTYGSILTRTYQTYVCRNCNNAQCKDW
eukprot:PhF_6_TR5199/c0_g1_i2/m.7485